MGDKLLKRNRAKDISTQRGFRAGKGQRCRKTKQERCKRKGGGGWRERARERGDTG